MPENFEQEANLSKEQLINQKYDEFLEAINKEKEIMKKIKVAFAEPIKKEDAKKAIEELVPQLKEMYEKSKKAMDEWLRQCENNS